MLGFFIGLFVGATLGIFLMSILTVGKIADMEVMIAALKVEISKPPVFLK